MPNFAPRAKRILRILALLLGVALLAYLVVHAERTSLWRTQEPLVGAFYLFSAWLGSRMS